MIDLLTGSLLVSGAGGGSRSRRPRSECSTPVAGGKV